jgi:methyl-accepting chemotaxis protein
MSKDFDMQRVSIVLAVLCLIGLGVTAYALYSAEISQGLTFVWTSLIVSSLLGGTSIVLALRQTKEIIVFKERDKNQEAMDNSSSGNHEEGKIDLSEITKIAQRGGKEVIVNGLKAICRQLEAGQGAFYAPREEDGARWLELAGGYALSIGESNTIKFDLGEGLIGQSAAEGRSLYIDDVPEGYMKIASGLGMASPRYLFITPVKKDEVVTGVLEVSTFKAMTEQQKKFVEEAARLLGSKA